MPPRRLRPGCWGMNASERDYYEMMGVPRDAGHRANEDVWHGLAMQWHPHRHAAPGPEAHAPYQRLAAVRAAAGAAS